HGGAFSWTPRLNQAGRYSVTFSAGDGSATATETAVLTVTNTNQAPRLVPVIPQYGRENVTLQFTAAAGDPDGEPLVRTVTGLPTGATFNASTGVVRWTPTYDQAGDYALTFRTEDPQHA